ncbi:hypothetical protein O181_110138 [Austropuccinia psidii MF-1]|uniref:Uncharacterized protein n=1 Tax=Austropuccinia psidii MF-1 TaxID=1389203 RepID=A0A9Q3PQH9_9BASI|nr:hypothetical protein [Austropuccinia psidii MF-1]
MHFPEAIFRLEENIIPLEAHLQANTPVTPSEPEGRKGKGKRHSEGLITDKKWTKIATQRNIKSQNAALIQGKPTLTTCTGQITIINPVVTSKGKFPKAGDSKFVQGTVKEDISQRPYGNHQRLESHQKVQTPGGEGKQDKVESSHYPSYRRTTDPDRAYSDSFRLTRCRPNPLSSGFKPFRNQKIRCQESPFFTIPGGLQEKTGIPGQKQDLFQPKAGRVRPNYPEAFGFGEGSTQEPEIAVHTSRVSSPINRNITPTQIEHDVVTPESNLNGDSLWLQMS